MTDVFCGFEWPNDNDSTHHCELRPNHRGFCVCSCGNRHARESFTTAAASSTSSRRFVLDRFADPSGVSGLGVVAEGVEFTDLSVALRWPGAFPSTAVWPSIEAVLVVHGHNGLTKVRWVD